MCISPTTRGQKKNVRDLLSLNKYKKSMKRVIRNSKPVAAVYLRWKAAVKHTNPTKRVTYTGTGGNENITFASESVVLNLFNCFFFHVM